jgi:hypothetical protein
VFRLEIRAVVYARDADIDRICVVVGSDDQAMLFALVVERTQEGGPLRP